MGGKTVSASQGKSKKTSRYPTDGGAGAGNQSVIGYVSDNITTDTHIHYPTHIDPQLLALNTGGPWEGNTHPNFRVANPLSETANAINFQASQQPPAFHFVSGDAIAGAIVPEQYLDGPQDRKTIEKRAQEKRSATNNACIEYVEPLRKEFPHIIGANEKRGIADSLQFLMKVTTEIKSRKDGLEQHAVAQQDRIQTLEAENAILNYRLAEAMAHIRALETGGREHRVPHAPGFSHGIDHSV